MDSTATPPDSGAVAVDSSASGTAPCLLNGLPPEAHQYIHALEERLRVVETALQENHARTKAMGQMIFKNPAAKMFLATMPKETQNRLREMFGDESNAVTSKNNGNGNS